jgi:hypothetical protein
MPTPEGILVIEKMNKKVGTFSHLLAWRPPARSPAGGAGRGSDIFASRMYLQIADALAACFSHSAKNCHCNEWPHAYR